MVDGDHEQAAGMGWAHEREAETRDGAGTHVGGFTSMPWRMGPQRRERDGRWRKEEGLPWEQGARPSPSQQPSNKEAERKKERKNPENRGNKTKTKRKLAVPGLDPGTFFSAPPLRGAH